MLALYPSVLKHRGFLANLGILTTTFVGLFAWVSGAPVVMQSAIYGLNPLVFGVTFALGAAGYMLGTFIAARIVMRIGIDRTMGIGCVILAAGGLIMAAVVALAPRQCHLVRRLDDDLSRRPRAWLCPPRWRARSRRFTIAPARPPR